MKITVTENGEEFEYERANIKFSNGYAKLYNDMNLGKDKTITVYLSPDIEILVYDN